MYPRLILVTDPAFGDDPIVRCVEAAALALPVGSFCVQLRDKRRAMASLRMFAGRLRLVTRACGARLVVNGSAHLARDVGADGVHLGRDAGTVGEVRSVLSGAWVSMAAHTDDDVRRAVVGGADAVLVSPIFSSRPPSVLGTAKEGRGTASIRAARAIAGSSLRVYALGGVTADNAPACRAAGADGVAVVRALLGSDRPGRVARAIHDVVAPRW